MQFLKNLGGTVLALLFIFAILDYLNLTAWLVLPVSSVRGTNKSVTTALGNAPSITNTSPGN